jgi:hypothetical protein
LFELLERAAVELGLLAPGSDWKVSAVVSAVDGLGLARSAPYACEAVMASASGSASGLAFASVFGRAPFSARRKNEAAVGNAVAVSDVDCVESVRNEKGMEH